MVEQVRKLLEKRVESPEGLESLRQSILAKRDLQRTCISVCGGTACRASGAEAVVDAFIDEIERRELQVKVSLKETGCHGFCERGPLVIIEPKKIFYQQVKPEDVEEIIDETILGGRVVKRLLYTDPVTNETVTHEPDVPFYKKQTRNIFGTNGTIDPTNIEDYIAVGGYSALNKALTMKPQQIIEEVKKSGLRGRGGGGFPTGRKWQSCLEAKGKVKYVICNADEGDPGAYMDRSLLEGNPHSILEGMIIGAYAIGAHEGYIYVRQEYPLACEHFILALDQARDYGLLGKNILGSRFNFDVQVNRGGGAFVCGESTALMASIEGKPGEPRAKHVHTVEKGLWERPSCLNNVETWANVPLIINRGAEWFATMGTGDVSEDAWSGSSGTKVFSLVGNVNNTGLIEVPMGISLREIIFDIGGGIPRGREFKAVQTGGPSGGCLPETALDMPVDFDSLTQAGSMMGSGGMIVMDDHACMVDVARYFINFLTDESCGKCVPCREGLRTCLETLNRIAEGQGREGDVELLQEISEVMQDCCLCALGTSAPNPVLSTIQYFGGEYQTHIRDHRCPAGVCKALIQYKIDPALCDGCHACVKPCPSGAISGTVKELHVLDQDKCTKCGVCIEMCKREAIVRV